MSLLSKALLASQRNVDSRLQERVGVWVWRITYLLERFVLSASLHVFGFSQTWLKGKIFSSEHFPFFFFLWSYYFNRKILLVLFDIIEFSSDIFLRLLEPEAAARARLDKKEKKKTCPRWEIESWQQSFNFLLRHWYAVGVFPANLRLLHLALLLTSARMQKLTLHFPNMCA